MADRVGAARLMLFIHRARSMDSKKVFVNEHVSSHVFGAPIVSGWKVTIAHVVLCLYGLRMYVKDKSSWLCYGNLVLKIYK